MIMALLRLPLQSAGRGGKSELSNAANLCKTPICVLECSVSMPLHKSSSGHVLFLRPLIPFGILISFYPRRCARLYSWDI